MDRQDPIFVENIVKIYIDRQKWVYRFVKQTFDL